MELLHGGDWAGFQTEYGVLPLDFSANLSPLGMPAGVRAAIAAALEGADRYPDPLCRALRTALAAREGVPAENILCGSGAADLIYRAAAARRPRRALVTAPAFAEYEAALRAVGCNVERYTLRAEDDFDVDAGFAEAVTADTDIVFLCQPNNPTGRTVPRAVLRRVLDRCRAAGALLVLDECFVDFLDDPAAVTLAGALAACPSLLILRSFTKLYAMAGVRLGYCLCADTAFLQSMAAAGPPWAVSTPAQAAGLAALREDAYAAAVRALVRAERPRLAAGLAALGLRVVPGQANYLLFRCQTPLLAPLRQKGILLRGCGNYPGLDESWYRAAVRTRAENERLLRALGEVLAGG